MRRPSPAFLLALAALILSMTGSAVAAKKYLITSTAQISPKVLHQLRSAGAAGVAGPAGAAGAAGAAGHDGAAGANGQAGTAGAAGTAKALLLYSQSDGIEIGSVNVVAVTRPAAPAGVFCVQIAASVDALHSVSVASPNFAADTTQSGTNMAQAVVEVDRDQGGGGIQCGSATNVVEVDTFARTFPGGVATLAPADEAFSLIVG